MLELYQFEGCPYCQKVRRALSDLQLDFVCRNVSPDAKSSRSTALMKLGGKMQVPFLVDQANSVYMYESADIIAYLHETYGSKK